MDRHHDELSTDRLICSPQADNAATTIHNIEVEEMLEMEQPRCGISKCCHGGSILGTGKEL